MKSLSQSSYIMNTLLKIVLPGIILWAQSLQAQQMSLKDCMTYALEHSSRLEIQRTHYDDALLERRTALLRAFSPEVSANTAVNWNFGRAIDPESNSYINTTSFNNGYSVQAGLTLFDGLSSINRIKMAKTAVKMGLSEEQQIKDEICLSVMEAYYKVLFHDEMETVLDSQLQTARTNLQLMQKLYELGQKSEAEVVQTESDLSEREYQLVCNRNNRDEAILNLKALMLWTSTDSLILDHSAARMESPEVTPLCEDPQTLTAFAREHQASARIAKDKMTRAGYDLRCARGLFSPTLSLNVGWSTNYYTYPGNEKYKATSFSHQFHNNGGEFVQLTLSIPLYSRLERFSSLRAKKNEYRRAEAAYRQTLQDIDNEVTRAVQNSEGAYAAFVQARKREAAQKEVYKTSTRQFALGTLSPIDYQTLANKYLNARAESLNALLQHRLKQSIVLFYKGISYLEQQH